MTDSSRDARHIDAATGLAWENGFIESLNGELRDELSRGEIFGSSLREARVPIEASRRH